MNSTAPINIPLRKLKIIMMLFGSVIYVAIGISFVSEPGIYDIPGRDSALIFRVGVAGIVFFGFLALFLIHKLLTIKPGLIIDKTGLIDNSSFVAAGRILWSDFQHISVVNIRRKRIIMVTVKNPQEYIDRQPNVLKRKMMMMNMNNYGTPISISSNALQIKFDELLMHLNNGLKSSRQ